jgi:hypothetical protein
MENTAPVMCAPRAVNVTVRRNTRPREYLTEREIEKLIEAASDNRWGPGIRNWQSTLKSKTRARPRTGRALPTSIAISKGYSDKAMRPLLDESKNRSCLMRRANATRADRRQISRLSETNV